MTRKSNEALAEEQDATEGVPAEDPEPKGLTSAELFAYNYGVVAGALGVTGNSKADKQQYALKAADVALQLVALQASIQRRAAQ